MKGYNDMKITAEFENVDSAERACAALRHSVSGITSIDISGSFAGGYPEEYTFYPVINPAYGPLSNNNIAAAVPLFFTDSSSHEPQQSDAVTVKVRCPQKYAGITSAYLVNYGGLSVKNSDL